MSLLLFPLREIQSEVERKKPVVASIVSEYLTIRPHLDARRDLSGNSHKEN